MNDSLLITDFIRTGGLKTIKDSEPDDFFFACGSFEPRSRTLTECLFEYRAKKSAIYVNTEFKGVGFTAQNCAEMEKALSIASDKFLGVYYGAWEDAAAQFKALRDMIAPNGVIKNDVRITLDITTFNREALIACISIIRWAYPNAILRLAYVSPEEYNPSGRAALLKMVEGRTINDLSPMLVQEHLWLSRGFRKMRNAIGLAGFQKPNLPAALILLAGYEVERPLTLVDNLEPSVVILGKPDDSTKDDFFERSVQAKDQMIRLFKARQPVEEFSFSCKSVQQAFESLRPIVEKFYNSHNIFISALSTKPTVIAVYLLAELYEKIQVTSSIPGEYNVDDYSSGAHKVSFFTMPEKIN